MRKKQRVVEGERLGAASRRKIEIGELLLRAAAFVPSERQDFFDATLAILKSSRKGHGGDRAEVSAADPDSSVDQGVLGLVMELAP